jgi:hypothetical protein
MSIYASCDCKNIEVFWCVGDLELVPRACQCEYFRSKSAAYVSQPNTKFEATVRNVESHKQIQHGSYSAIFHECSICEQVVFVTAEMDGHRFGALNADRFIDQSVVSAPVKMDFRSQSGKDKRERWRQNWCRPVQVRIL